MIIHDLTYPNALPNTPSALPHNGGEQLNISRWPGSPQGGIALPKLSPTVGESEWGRAALPNEFVLSPSWGRADFALPHSGGERTALVYSYILILISKKIRGLRTRKTHNT